MSTTTPAKRPKTGGGSRRGKPNRAKAAFREELQAYCDDRDFNPFFAMVELAMDRTLDDQHLRFLALKELCQYLQPKLRSVELTGDSDRPLHITVKTTLRQLAANVAVQQAEGSRRGSCRSPHTCVAAA